MRRLVPVVLVLSLAAPAIAQPVARPSPAVVVAAEAPGRPFPVDLLGVGGPPATGEVEQAVDDAGLPWMRVDAYLDRVAPEPGVRDWSGFYARIEAARRSGAEPVVILAYSPPWLADCPVFDGVDPAHCPPGDASAWRQLVREAVRRAVTRHDVTTFEVWNEPDNPQFFRGTPADYADLYAETTRAVERVAADLGRDLAVGGPAAVGPDPVLFHAWLARARADGLPVDFVSFHWYADNPFHGPVGPSPGTPVRDSPLVAARTYRDQARQVRAWTDAHGFPGADLWIDEWNLDAGDAERTRSRFGAAFVVQAVRAMAKGPVDRAAYYDLQSDAWGLFAPDGTPRPTWDAFAALARAGPTALPVDDPDPEVAAVAATNGTETTVLLAHADARGDGPTQGPVEVTGLAGHPYTLRDLDGTVLEEGRLPETLSLPMPDPSVRRLTIR